MEIRGAGLKLPLSLPSDQLRVTPPIYDALTRSSGAHFGRTGCLSLGSHCIVVRVGSYFLPLFTGLRRPGMHLRVLITPVESRRPQFSKSILFQADDIDTAGLHICQGVATYFCHRSLSFSSRKASKSFNAFLLMSNLSRASLNAFRESLS